jgi:hypothetical protein
MRFINDQPFEGPTGPPGPTGATGAAGVPWPDTAGCFLTRTGQVNNNGTIYTKCAMAVRRLTNEASVNPTFDAGSNEIKIPTTPTNQRYFFSLLFNVTAGLTYTCFFVQLRDNSSNVIIEHNIAPPLLTATMNVTFSVVLDSSKTYSLWTQVNSSSGGHTLNSLRGIMTLVNNL